MKDSRKTGRGKYESEEDTEEEEEEDQVCVS